MDKIRNWESLSEFFNVLNKRVEYVVLRNYEEFLDGKFNIDHPDIDILCRDSMELIKIAGSTTRTGNSKDLIHQKIVIDGITVALDVRHVGDGYYDEAWEVEMLNNRRLINGLCYVMNEENYFYSLLYHALIQKRKMADDYKYRLEKMAKSLPCNFVNSPVTLEALQMFMRENNYYFTYPEFLGGTVNFSKVDKRMIRSKRKHTLLRLIYRMKHIIVNKLK